MTVEQTLITIGGLKVFPLERRVAGIYLLFKNDQLIYIGQSVNIWARLGTHNTIQFDKILYLECLESDLNLIETVLIRKLNPILNKRKTANKKNRSKEKEKVHTYIKNPFSEYQINEIWTQMTHIGGVLKN